MVGATAAITASALATGGGGELAELGSIWAFRFSKNCVWPGPVCFAVTGACLTVWGGNGASRWSGLGGRGGEAPAGGARLASRDTIRLASPKCSSVAGVTTCQVFPMGAPLRNTGDVAGSTAAANTCSPSNVSSTWKLATPAPETIQSPREPTENCGTASPRVKLRVGSWVRPVTILRMMCWLSMPDDAGFWSGTSRYRCASFEIHCWRNTSGSRGRQPPPSRGWKTSG